MWPAGLSGAAVSALRNGTIEVQGRVLHMLFCFLISLEKPVQPDEIAVLLAGGVVEIAVGYMAEGPLLEDHSPQAILLFFLGHPQSGVRMCGDDLVAPLMKGISRWLLQVSDGPLASSGMCMHLMHQG